MYLTITQTAAVLAISEPKVRRMIHDGYLITAPLGGPRGTRVLVASLPVPERLRQQLINASLRGVPAGRIT